MKRKSKIMIIAFILILFILAWAPWLNNEEIHDKVLRERGWKDGTITLPNRFRNISEEALQQLVEKSKRKGVENGILICDYNVMWFPFGRWVASCEGGYYVTLWGKPIYSPSGRGGIILP